MSNVRTEAAEWAAEQGRYRRAWSRQYTEDVTGIPPYGSTQWAALPPGDPRKLAAAVRAAEAWAKDGEELEAEHVQRLYDLRVAAEERQAERDKAAAQVAREAVGALDRVAHRARRTAELQARAEAGDDHPGQTTPTTTETESAA